MFVFWRKRTQARYGSAVASYFHFYRWLVGTYIFIASLSLVWIVFHVLKQVNQRRSTIFGASLVGERLPDAGGRCPLTLPLPTAIAWMTTVFELHLQLRTSSCRICSGPLRMTLVPITYPGG